MKIDKSVINNINKKNIMGAIRDNGQIFKAEIARMTDLSIPTVMKITEELMERGIVRDIGKGESSGGKPPHLLEFVPDCRYIVGVDIGSTNIVCILMDMSSKIYYKRITPTYGNYEPEEIIKSVIQSIDSVIAGSKVEQAKILGIGIGMPGLLDIETGVVLFSPDFKWENVNLLAPIKAKFNMTIIFNNVTRAMAIGEKWFGYGRGNINSFICVNLGYGIGSALFMNGQLYGGGSGSSGELGHMTMEKNGPECDCGNFGCLEALASGNAIAKRATNYIQKGEKSIIRPKAGSDTIEAIDVFDASKQNDLFAIEIINNAAEYIGIALANIINFIDPEIIILEGGISRAGGVFLETIHKVVQRRQMKYAGRHTKIVVSKLAEDAAAIGAASLLLKMFFDVGGDSSAMK